MQADYFDGIHARAQLVTLRVADGRLHLQGDNIQHSIPLAGVHWPERTRHGMRVTQLDEGGELHCADSAAWDTWYRDQGLGESLTVRLQQSWRGVLASLLALIALLGALQVWGLPLAAQASLLVLPQSVDIGLGEATLHAVDTQLMRPSRLPLAEQARVQAAFAQAVAHLPADEVPDWQLVFRSSRIGPNALALPGGTIIMTDELVYLVNRDTDVLTAVLGHELGHLQHRDGVRMLVQTTLLGTVGSLLLGDFSSLLAGTTALLGQAHYSRSAEHEADIAAVRLLQAAGIPPASMVTLFDKLAAARQQKEDADKDAEDDSDHWLGIAFASHPSDTERVRFFQQAGQNR